jgi:beta-lactam-binding protein with PASTA domain
MVSAGAAGLALVGAGLALAACGGAHRASTTPTAARPQVTVPRVAGLPVSVGERRIRRAGLVWNPQYAGSAGNPQIVATADIVLHQGPAPGTRVAKGSSVGVAIGIDPAEIARMNNTRPQNYKHLPAHKP